MQACNQNANDSKKTIFGLIIRPEVAEICLSPWTGDRSSDNRRRNVRSVLKTNSSRGIRLTEIIHHKPANAITFMIINKAKIGQIKQNISKSVNICQCLTCFVN